MMSPRRCTPPTWPVGPAIADTSAQVAGPAMKGKWGLAASPPVSLRGSSRDAWRSASVRADTPGIIARFAATRRSCGCEGEGFTRVVSLLPSPHNLHAYDEIGHDVEPYPLRSPR